MTRRDKYDTLFVLERVDEHVIRPELIKAASERIMPEALKQIISCERRECNNGTGLCDNSCLEAQAFITGKGLEDGDKDD
jgi:hypothetical protein